MTLKIETRRSGDSLIVQLIGEFDVEHLDEVKARDSQPLHTREPRVRQRQLRGDSTLSHRVGALRP